MIESNYSRIDSRKDSISPLGHPWGHKLHYIIQWLHVIIAYQSWYSITRLSISNSPIHYVIEHFTFMP